MFRRSLGLSLCLAGVSLAMWSFAARSTSTLSGSWAIEPSQNAKPTPTDNFPFAVTCVSDSDCWAVGYYNNVAAYQTLTQHWDGNAWTIVDSPSTNVTQQNVLRSVACNSTSDCWAVGSFNDGTTSQNLIEHWDGNTWSIVPSPNTSTTQYQFLTNVTCRSSTDCWAVGAFNNGTTYQTLAMHWNGSAWSIVASPSTSATRENVFNGVACNSPNDCWAAGWAVNSTTGKFQTLIEHWNGSAWTIATSPNTLPTQDNFLNAITCASTSDCWAVGYAKGALADQTLIERWDGSAWSIATSANTNLTQVNRLYGITCAPSQCFAVGYFNNGVVDQTLIQRWDGSAWAIVTSPNSSATQMNNLKGVACTSTSSCWAMGFFQSGLVQQALAQRWNGSAWTTVASPNEAAAQNNTLLGNTCVAANDCWAVGSFYNGSVQQTLIQHWNGSAWSIIPSANTSATLSNILYDIACTSTSDCWTVGYALNGLAFQTFTQHWDGNAWSIVDSPSTSATQNNFLYDVTCRSSNDCWAVGSYDSDGNGTDQTLVEHWDGNAWTIVASPNTSTAQKNRLYSVACPSTSDCWAVGRWFNADTIRWQTLAEHWDGDAWTIVASANTSANEENVFWGVTCTSSSNCFAVGSHGDGAGTGQPLIEQWNGSAWSIVPSPEPTNDPQFNYNFLRGVSCTSTSNCWTAGYSFSDGAYRTLIEHWNGSAWEIVTSPNTSATQYNYLIGISCVSAFDCRATGYATDDAGVYHTLIEHYIAPVPLLQITAITRLTNGHVMISGASDPLLSIQLQSSSDLKSFATVGSTTTDATGAFQFDDADAATMSQRFYRAVYP